MKQSRNVRARWILCVLYILIGISLLSVSAMGRVDEYWSSMGIALIMVGGLQMIRLIRYKTSPQYKESTDTAANDERNHFIRAKTWSWVGYLYIMIAAIASIVFKLLDQETLMFAASGSVCLMLILYWIIYLILSKKY